MQADRALAALALSEVVDGCRDETVRYRRGEAHDDRFCFELFRRAIAERVEPCWEALQTIYRDQVLAWCRRAGRAGEDFEELAAVAWEKFWQHFTPGKLASAGGTPAVLGYLKTCAMSAAVDAARATAASQRWLDAGELEGPDRQPLPGDVQADRAAAAVLWQLVDARLRNDRERMLVHLTYEIGLKPAEIQARRPDLFPSTGDVYQATQTILKRLRRTPGLRAWFESGGTE